MLPSVLTPCRWAAVQSAIVSMRSGATPREMAISTYPLPKVSMNASGGPASGVADAFLHAVAVVHRHDAVVAEPAVVRRAGEPEHGRTGEAGQLHGDGPDATRGPGHDDGVVRAGSHGLDRRKGCRPRDEQRPRHLPRHPGRAGGEVVGVDSDQLGLAGPVVRESDDLVADRHPGDAVGHLVDEPREVAALPRGERRRPSLVQQPGAD
jgi:hypothetical protein